MQVDVSVDIQRAIRDLNLLPKEADRASYRAMNKIADEIKKDSAKQISALTGLTVDQVYSRMYIRGANSQRPMAVVAALNSAKNVGYYDGANVRPKPALSKDYGAGLSLRAWGKPNFYDKAFVMGKQGAVSARRKVWKRTGPGKGQISDKVWGPSIRATFTWNEVRTRQVEIIKGRWSKWFEFYLRGEIARLRGRDALKGVTNVLPGLAGPTFRDGT